MVSNKIQDASGPERYWFYDLEDKTLLAASTDEIAPIGTPLGGEGGRAVVYGCGDCPDNLDDLQIVYLTKLAPQAKAMRLDFIQRAKDSGQKNVYIARDIDPMGTLYYSKVDKIHCLPAMIPEVVKFT